MINSLQYIMKHMYIIKRSLFFNSLFLSIWTNVLEKIIKTIVQISHFKMQNHKTNYRLEVILILIKKFACYGTSLVVQW